MGVRGRGRSGLLAWGVGLAVALPLGLARAAPGSAAAGERWVEPLRGPGSAVDRWSTGRLEFGEESDFHWVRCTTQGSGRPSLLTSAGSYDPPLDLRGQFIKVWLRVDAPERIADLELRLSSDGFASSFFTFGVPLFGDPDFGILKANRWIPLTFPLGTASVVGTPDRGRIDSVGWYVEDRGKGPVAFSWGGLALVKAPEEGVVSFTFDDGYDEHAQIAAPLLARHGMRATAYVMPDQIGTPGYMTLAELEALRDRYGWDVAAHHAIPFTDFTPEKLETTLLGIRRYLQVHGFGAGADHLALPLGKHDVENVLPLVRKFFRTTRLASAGPETLPPADPHRLRVLNVLATTSPEQVGAWALRARNDGEWAILMFHFLVDQPHKDTDYTKVNFRRAVEAVQRTGVQVRTVNEVWEALTGPVGRRAPARAVHGIGSSPGSGTRPVPASVAPSP